MTTRNGTERVVVDSSGWLEYITDDSKAELFARYFEGDLELLIPVIVIYEVRKVLLLRQLRQLADIFVSQALQRRVLPIDENVALAAAEFSIRHELPMGDALLYASARGEDAEFVTSDSHFQGLPGVTLL